MAKHPGRNDLLNEATIEASAPRAAGRRWGHARSTLGAVALLLGSPAVGAIAPADPDLIPEARALLARLESTYPGAAYVDIAGIDIYPNQPLGLGAPQGDAYARSFAVMQQVAPGKMLALCECEAMPAPELIAQGGPRWLYTLPWWGEGKRHPAEWIKRTYPHDVYLTLDEWKR